MFVIKPFGSNADTNIFLKRKVGLEKECPLKKRRLTNYKSNENVIHPIKRIIDSDNIQDPFKKVKIGYSSTGALKSHSSMHVPLVSNLAIVV